MTTIATNGRISPDLSQQEQDNAGNELNSGLFPYRHRRDLGGRAVVVSPPAHIFRRTRARGGTAAMLASGFAAPFLTRLAAVSSLSFAVPRVLRGALTA